MEYSTLEEILCKAKEAEGKTFKDFDRNNRLSSKGNKGGLGQIIEEGLFEYQVNSNAEADFSEFNVELKVTPVKINNNKTISSKERLVLNIINYMTEWESTFETSSFWKKNKTLLMMFYLWEKEIPRSNYTILKSILYQFPEADLEIIKADWETIIEKIRQGKAHEISESDTFYLAACTKGTNSSSLRTQPFSVEPAMQRAYSLKASYMTTLVRKIFNNEKIEAFTSSGQLREKTLDEILWEKFSPYFGETVEGISEEIDYQINPSNKAAIANMISHILGIKGTKLDDIEEFAKANIQFKTVRLEPNGMPKEHMSFENINFQRWLEKDWEDSQLYQKFEQTKFLFIVFEYKEKKEDNPSRECYFRTIKLWNMPEKTIENELRAFWEEVRTILRKGVVLTETKRGVKNNFPNSSFNGICHMRPKARDGSDKVQLPDGQHITKQCYWLNREYIVSEILK